VLSSTLQDLLSVARAMAVGEQPLGRSQILLRFAFAGTALVLSVMILVLLVNAGCDGSRGCSQDAADAHLSYARFVAEDRKGKALSLKEPIDGKEGAPSLGQGAKADRGAVVHGASFGEQVVVPPLLCPSVSLPQGDVEFSLPAESLQKLCDSQHSAEILGPGGLPFLFARFATARAGGASPCGGGARGGSWDSQGLWLELAETATSRYPYACVGPLCVGSIPLEALELCGPRGRHYGLLKPGEGTWQAQHKMHKGCPLLSIELIDLPSFTITASASDSTTAVSATLVGANGAWQVHAKPGSDPLLALLCMLAMVLTVPDRCRY
jgi:hypothetical protein